MSVRPRSCTTSAAARTHVDAVLGTHDPEVGDEVLAGRGAAPGPAALRRRRSGSGPVRTTVTSLGRLPPRRIATSA